jgi:hypothetical protein
MDGNNPWPDFRLEKDNMRIPEPDYVCLCIECYKSRDCFFICISCVITLQCEKHTNCMG